MILRQNLQVQLSGNSEKKNNWFFRFWLWIGIYIVFYLFLNLKYNIDKIDDVWNLSWAYGLIHFHTFTPGVFFDHGIIAFGVIWAAIQGFILDIIGWTKLNAHLISFGFGIGSLYLIFYLLKETFSELFAFTFVLVFSISEPFFASVTLARVDIFGLFLLILFLFLVFKKAPLFAGIILMLSLESHPAPFIFSLFYGIVFIWKWIKKQRIKLDLYFLLKFLIGMVIGLLIYLSIHYPYLHHIRGILLEGRKTGRPGLFHTPLYSYYFEAKYYRHIPELIILALSLILYFINWKRADRFPVLLLFSGILSTYLIGRANPNYTVYFYISYFIFVIYTFKNFTKVLSWKAIIILFLLLWFPQYAFLYIKNYNISFTDYIHDLKEGYHSREAGEKPIFGDPNSWFIFYKNRNFKVYGELVWVKIRINRLKGQGYVICNKNYTISCKGVLNYLKKMHIKYTEVYDGKYSKILKIYK